MAHTGHMGQAAMVGMATLGFEGLLSHVMFSREATQAIIRAMRASESGQMQVATANIIRAIELVQPTKEVGQLMGQRIRDAMSSPLTVTPDKPKPPVPPTGPAYFGQPAVNQ
jgi:hypothetical protein